MKQVKPRLAMCALVLISACTGSTDYTDTSAQADELVLLGDDNAVAVELFEDDVTVGLDDLPAIVLRETLPETGLEIAYTTGLQRDWIDPIGIQFQWEHMLACTGVALRAPLIMIVENDARLLSADDDVIRYIDGSTVASSSRTIDGPVLQVSESDFDGSIGTPGFNLRAIMGRYLWFGASLAERDYPFECTRL